MQVAGNFKVVSKKRLENGNNTYELGDVSTFGILRINMPVDLQVDTVVPLQMMVTPKHGKYGDYLTVSGEVKVGQAKPADQ